MPDTQQQPANSEEAIQWLNDQFYHRPLLAKVAAAGVPIASEADASLVIEMAGRLRQYYDSEQQKRASAASSMLAKAAAALGASVQPDTVAQHQDRLKQAAAYFANNDPDTARNVLAALSALGNQATA